jgi:hypothetical protein
VNICAHSSDNDPRIAASTRLLASRLSVSDRAGAFGERGLGYLNKGDNDRAIADYDVVKISPNKQIF